MATPAEVLEHLGYEWWMFRETYELIRCSGDKHTPERNAFVESLAIHGRALVQFFYFQKSKKHGGTNWNVTDLGMQLPVGQLPAELKVWYEETGQYVAHLTERRVSALASVKAGRVRALLAQYVDNVTTKMAAPLAPDWIGKRPTTLRCPDEGGAAIEFGPTGASRPMV